MCWFLYVFIWLYVYIVCMCAGVCRCVVSEPPSAAAAADRRSRDRKVIANVSLQPQRYLINLCTACFLVLCLCLGVYGVCVSDVFAELHNPVCL